MSDLSAALAEAAAFIDRVDWCTPADVVAHLAITPEGLAHRPMAALDTASGAVVARWCTAAEVDVLDALARSHGTTPAVGCLVPVADVTDAPPELRVHFRSRRLFGERPGPKEAHR